mgnify:CR=1 FL=1
MAMACNSQIHHSVLSHYNHAHVIVRAKVVKVGNPNKKNYSFEVVNKEERSFFVKFEIEQTYKNTTLETTEIIVGKSPDDYAEYEVGKTYLIHAYPDARYDFLLVGQGILCSDSTAMAAYEFMYSMPLNYTGYIEEISKFGRVRAAGKLVNGIAEGEWNYYGWSGELQIKGSYEEGEELGEWQYYHHTTDAAYLILEQIYSGAYYEWSQEYKLVAMDSNLVGKFNKSITYLLEGKPMVERYYYNQKILQQTAQFRQGFLNGTENTFAENGDTLSQYTFERGRLEGAFFSVQHLPSKEGVTLRVVGRYHQGKKQTETHCYYENDVLYSEKKIIEAGKLIE